MIKTNKKEVIIPFFRVGVAPYTDAELKDIFDAVEKAKKNRNKK